MKFIINFSVLILLYLIGVLIFSSGFLLRRIVVNEKSNCSQDTCIGERSFDKAIIIIIDALRNDFLTFNESLTNPLPFQNNFKHLHHLLKTKPNNSRTYRFIADPPTTTLQRLKALTTGSLPTFIDAGSNFASSEITEDNLIDQLRHSNQSITFMGDDTWTGLYPGRFNASMAYSSFNVKDLHTVDNAVIRDTVPQMQAGGYTLLISHLLGVDHCGHTFGPYHEKMRQKLAQMDDFIISVVEKMDEDSVLFVLGDHGMTRTGDHGGDSEEEVEAGLFVYSKKEIFTDDADDGGEAQKAGVDQIDLLPTLSLLLNLPIPYQNLGVVITEMFARVEDDTGLHGEKDANRQKSLLQQLKYLSANAMQVKEYISTYQEKAGVDEELLKLNDEMTKIKFAYDVLLREMKHNSTSAGSVDELKALKNSLRAYVLAVRQVLRKSWAQFDLAKMFVGVVVMVVSFLLNVIFISHTDSILSTRVAAVVFSAEILLFFFILSNSEHSLNLTIAFISFFFIYFIFTTTFKKGFFGTLPGMHDSFSILTWLAYSLSLLSNSYLVNEHQVIFFFLITSILLHAANLLRASLKQISDSSSSKPLNFNYGIIIIITAYVTTMVMVLSSLLHVSTWYYSCREEQAACVDGWMLADAAVSPSIHPKNRLLVSLCCIVVTSLVAYKWLKSNGSLIAWSVAGVVGSYTPIISSTLIILYWCFSSALPPDQGTQQLNSIVQIAYFFLISSTILITISPSTAHSILHQPLSHATINMPDINSFTSHHQLIPSLFNKLKSSWQSPSDQATKASIYVYGLQTSFSSPLLIISLNVSLLLSLLLGPSVSSSLSLYGVIVFVFLEMHALAAKTSSQQNLFNVSTSSISTFLLLTSHHFYALSHHPTITSIPWQAAFVGVDGNHINNVIAAIMIGANAFSAQIISSLISPLLLYWPLIRGRWPKLPGESIKSETNGSHKKNLINKNKVLNNSKYAVKSVDDDTAMETTATNASVAQEEHRGGGRGGGSLGDADMGEYRLREATNDVQRPLSNLLLKVTCFLALKMLAAMACAAVHRRHLMVWKIFAPRFICEAASFGICSIVLVFTFVFAHSSGRSLDRFVKRLAV